MRAASEIIWACVVLNFAVGGVRAQGPVLDDPLPLQRVVIPLSRLPAELERARPGILVQMPRSEFEALVQRAARASDPAREAARLIKASYRAEFIRDSLVQGAGQWTIHQQGTAPSVLPVPSFNLALNKAHWAGGGDAVLGNLDGKSLGLFVDKAGEIFFDWSLRGTPIPGGVQFDLQVPPCPVGLLELKVPADHHVVGSKALLLSGPEDAGDPAKRLWRLQFNGRSPVDFQVRKPAEAKQATPLVLSQLQSAQQITPERVAADFEFQVEVLRTTVRELVFDCDPALQPYEVSMRNADLSDWEFKEAPPPSDAAGKKGTGALKPATLIVHLREPFQGSLQGLKIRCLAPRVTDKPWTSPSIYLRQARARGEALKLQVHPDVQMESWDAAGFRLLSSTTTSDGSQVLSLVDPAAGLDPSRRPVAAFKSQGFELLTREQVRWHIGPKGSTLTADIAYELAQGHLFQLSVKLPGPNTSWHVEAVAAEPKETLRSWATSGSLLMVDLQRGLNPRNPVKLSVRLVQRLESVQAARTLTVPVLEPVDATARQGALAISVDPLFQVTWLQATTPLVVPTAASLWGTTPPQYLLQYRDKAVGGQLRLFPQKARVRVWCREEIVLTQGRAGVEARLEVEPVLGNPTALDFMVTGKALSWHVDSGPVRVLERRLLPEALARLLCLGETQPLANLVLHGQLPNAQHWRLQLHKPLERRETISLRGTVDPRHVTVAPAAQAWDIPLFVVADADRYDGEISVQSAGVEAVQMEARGLEEVTVPSGSKPAVRNDAWRLFRFANSLPGNIPWLTVTTQATAAAVATREWCDQANLVTYVETGDFLLHHFRFHAWNWRTRDLTVLLPTGTAKVLAAKVDGHWLEQFGHVEVENGWQVKLPATMDRAGHRYDVYYLTKVAWSGWPSGADLKGMVPQLPVPSASFRRTWRLAPGLVPLHQEHLQPLSDVTGLSDDLRRLWHLGDPVLHEVIAAGGEDAFLSQRKVVLGAEYSLHRKLTRDTTLGEALDRLAHEFQLPVVLDRAAMRAADVRLESSLAPMITGSAAPARPFWEYLGLVYIPFATGPVFTTVQQLEAWRAQYGRDADVRLACDPDVAEAIARGHDARGRFTTLGHWLRTEKKAEAPPAALFLSAGDGWTVWEPRPGHAADADLVVFQLASLRSLSLVLAALMALVTWRVGRFFSATWCFRLWVLWLLGLGLTSLWLPPALQPIVWWPVLLAGAWTCVWLVRFLLVYRTIPSRPSKSTKVAKALVGSATVLLLMPGSMAPQGRSEGPEPYTVLIVESEPGRQLALVTQDLLKKLGELERSASTPSGAVLLGARYQGAMKGNLAEFTAQFEIHSFADRAKLLLPLTGVQLQEGSFLDGVPVFPVAPPSPKSGYVVPVTGKGAHRLVLSFTVRPTPSGDYQEVRFAAPTLCTSQLKWTMTGPAPGMQLVHSMGAQRQDARAPDLKELRASLGRESSVQLRWRLQQPPAGPIAAEVREAYFWDLRAGTVSLAAALQFVPVKGALTHLALVVPEGIDLRSLDATTGSGTMTPSPGLVSKWYFTGSGMERQLHVELASPVASRVQLSLNLIPGINLATGNVLLRLPLPLTVKQTESFLAYRLEGWDVIDKTQNLGVTSIGTDVFGKVWGGAGQKDPGPVSRAYSFRRTAGNAGLGLTLTVPRPRAHGDVTWTLGPQHADFAAQLQFRSTGADVSLVEMFVPTGITLADVRGPAVHHWSRQKAHVQIWLQQSRKQVNLELTGWAPLAQTATTTKPGQFILPALQFAHVDVESLQIKVVPAAGVAVHSERLRNLGKGAEPNTFTPEGPVYDGAFQVKLAPPPAEARILTTAEVREGSCVLVSHVHCQATSGNLGPLQIVLRKWPSADVRLEFPGTAPRSSHRHVGEDHVWDITLPPRAPQPFTCRVWARIPLKDLARLSNPEVSAPGLHVADRWLAITGSELRPENDEHLVLVTGVTTALRLWPAEARRILSDGKAWHIEDPEWGLHLTSRSAQDTPAVKVLLAEEQVYLADGSRWIHQADFELAARGDSDLQVSLPAGARLLALTVDEQPVTPRTSGSQSYWVFLGGPVGPRSLRVRWQFAPGAEPLDRPTLGGAQLVGVAAPELRGRLLLPTGYHISLLPDGVQSGQMQMLLARAQARLELCRFLLKHAGTEAMPALLLAQKSLRWHLRQADLQISYVTKEEEKPKYTAALETLRKENEALLQDKGLDNVRAQADKHTTDMGVSATPLAGVPEQGRPVFWRLPRAQRFLGVALEDQSERRRGQARHWSEMLVLAAVALLVLSYMPRSLGYLAYLWPETCILLALAGMFAWGVSLPGVLAAALGIGGRLRWAIEILRRVLVAHWRPKKAGPSSTMQPLR